jgi:hypothetical protein
MVPTGFDPATVPILHALYGWVVLHEDGTASGVAEPKGSGCE